MPHPVIPVSGSAPVARLSPAQPSRTEAAAELEVLVILPLQVEGAAALLAGISHANQHGPRWRFFFDFDGRSLHDTCWLQTSPWRGVLCAGATDQLREACGRQKIPLVELGGTDEIASNVAVRSNDEAVGQLAARRVVELRAASSGFLRTGEDASARRREAAFAQALQTAQQPAPLTLALDGPLTQPETYREQIQAIGAWLTQLAHRPAVVVADSGARAHQLVLAARARGLQVPQDLSVLALSSDEAVCASILPPVESIDVGAEKIGAAAVDTLVRLIARKKPAARVHEIDPAGVIVRGSTLRAAGSPGLVSRALSFIQAHPGAEPSIAAVLEHTGATRSQLEHAFRACLGRSPQQEIRRLRVEFLERLLARSDEPLSVLARQAGFKHVEYLSVFFKRATGLNPGEFRRRARAGATPGDPTLPRTGSKLAARVA